jgi:hypothetical protein
MRLNLRDRKARQGARILRTVKFWNYWPALLMLALSTVTDRVACADSAVPIDINLPVTVWLDGSEGQSGINFASASREWSDPSGSEGGAAYAMIDCSSGAWGAKIETHLQASVQPAGVARNTHADIWSEYMGPGTVTIGTLPSIPAGAPLMLVVDIETTGDPYNNPNPPVFWLRRPAPWDSGSTLEYMNLAQGGEFPVFAGETLYVGCLQMGLYTGESNGSILGYDLDGSRSYDMRIVPEPAAICLLMIATMCGTTYVWLRRRGILRAN